MADPSRRDLPAAPDATDGQWDSIRRADATVRDAETGTHRVEFDVRRRSIVLAIVSTVSVVAETRPLELPPLNSAVDPDALERLVESCATGDSPGDLHVSFSYHGSEVTVHSYGIIEVRPH